MPKKATQAGYTVGKALEAWECKSSVVSRQSSESLIADSCSPTIEVFVNLGYSDPDLQLIGLEGLSFNATDSAEPVGGWATVFTLMRAVTDGVSQTIDRIGAFGQLITANLRAGTIVADTLSAISLQLSDRLYTDIISPIATDSAGIAVRLGETQTFEITNDQGSPSATFDAVGNATFSGKLSAGKIVIPGLTRDPAYNTLDSRVRGNDILLDVRGSASVSGTLFANRIRTSFGDLDDKLGTIEQSLRIISSASGLPANYVATASSELANAVSVNNGDLVVNTNLFVLGDTALSSTSITGSLLVDGIIHFTQNMIETIGETLYIQKAKLAAVDILDGTVFIDTFNRIFFKGDVAITGNTTVGGVLGARIISPIADNDLVFDLTRPTLRFGGPIPELTASSSALPASGFADLIIRGIDNKIVARIDASGSATFAGDLTIEGATRLNGPVQLSSKSLGTSVAMATGAGELVIDGFMLPDANYSLFVTPSWNTSVWTGAKTPAGATIYFSIPAPTSATVDWLILLREPSGSPQATSSAIITN